MRRGGPSWRPGPARDVAGFRAGQSRQAAAVGGKYSPRPLFMLHLPRHFNARGRRWSEVPGRRTGQPAQQGRLTRRSPSPVAGPTIQVGQLETRTSGRDARAHLYGGKSPADRCVRIRLRKGRGQPLPRPTHFRRKAPCHVQRGMRTAPAGVQMSRLFRSTQRSPRPRALRLQRPFGRTGERWASNIVRRALPAHLFTAEGEAPCRSVVRSAAGRGGGGHHAVSSAGVTRRQEQGPRGMERVNRPQRFSMPQVGTASPETPGLKVA